MDPLLDLDDAFMQELLQIVSPVTLNMPTQSDDELSPSSGSVQAPRDDGVAAKKGTSTSDTAKAKRKRKCRRLEVLELRTQVATHKQKLDSLLLHKYDKSKGGNFWQRTAHRIALDKRLAVRENARLRTLMEQKMDTIQALQQSILNIDPASPMVWPSDIDPPVLDLLPPSPKNVARSHNKRRLNTDIDNSGGVSLVHIQLEDTQTIPFNFQLVGNQTWNYLSQSHDHEQRQGIYRDFKPEGDALIGMLIQGGVGDNVLVRKLVEPHRVSFFWETTPHDCHSESRGQEKGCLYLEAFPEDPANASMCVTTVHFEPQRLGEAGVGAATDAVLSTYDDSIGFFRQAIIASLHNDGNPPSDSELS